MSQYTLVALLTKLLLDPLKLDLPAQIYGDSRDNVWPGNILRMLMAACSDQVEIRAARHRQIFF